MASWMSYTTASAAVIVGLAMYLRRQSAVGNIAGPPSPSWIFGHMRQLLFSPVYGEVEFEWQKSYGPLYRIKGCFGQDLLMVSDPIAFQYIVNSPHFKPGPLLETMTTWLFGEKSVNLLQGATHRRLRAALNAGFTANAVRRYQPVFEKVAQMITAQLEDSPTPSINMCPLLNSASLNAVSEGSSQLFSVVPLKIWGKDFEENNTELIALTASQSAAQLPAYVIGAWFPGWLLGMVTYLPTTAFRALRKARYIANRVGGQTARAKMDAARQGLEMNADLFSLLLNPDKSAKSGKELRTEEVVEQTAILLIAGQETSATTLAFGLLELGRHPEFQEQLRAEIHSTFGAGSQNVSYDNMPLLNAFIKEVLRIYPADPLVDRVAVRDTVIPLAGSITTSTGERITRIPIQKGQLLTLAIASSQRLESRWGADAHEFRPARWIEGTPYQGEAVGPYAGLVSFSGGPHVCLGWRFAILEMQVIVCELVGKFSFALTEDSVRTRVANTLLPVIDSGEKSAPLCVTRIL